MLFFIPIWGNDPISRSHIFLKRGWFNHQLQLIFSGLKTLVVSGWVVHRHSAGHPVHHLDERARFGGMVELDHQDGGNTFSNEKTNMVV